MNMKSIVARIVLIAAIVGTAGFAFVRTADATDLVAEVTLPDQAEVGHLAQLQFELRSADQGAPVPGAVVTVYSDASFAGVRGEIELGKAVTDENGVAIVGYQPSSAGEHQLRIEYIAPGESEPEVTMATISVEGAAQLHRSAAGIQIPGLNVWLIIALVSLVWSILFSVGLRVYFIARASTVLEPVADLAALPQRMEAQAAGEAGTSGS